MTCTEFDMYLISTSNHLSSIVHQSSLVSSLMWHLLLKPSYQKVNGNHLFCTMDPKIEYWSLSLSTHCLSVVYPQTWVSRMSTSKLLFFIGAQILNAALLSFTSVPFFLGQEEHLIYSLPLKPLYKKD